MFSGEAADSKEHIIPGWMQRRYGLANQTHVLPNGTEIRYALATVSVATAHNAKFGEIENRIAEGKASDLDFYLWAFKVHIGLICRNSKLKIDIKSPSSPKFWSLNRFGDEIWLFQQLYKVWAAGGSIEPNPFGSVIRAAAFDVAAPFDFIHNMQAGVVMFQLGGELIFVSLYDQGRLANSNIQQMVDYHRNRIANLPAEERSEAAFMGHRVWACEASYALYRTAFSGLNFIQSPTTFLALPSRAPTMRPASELEYGIFCQSFGLELVNFGGEANHTYQPLNIENPKFQGLASRPAAANTESNEGQGDPG